MERKRARAALKREHEKRIKAGEIDKTDSYYHRWAKSHYLERDDSAIEELAQEKKKKLDEELANSGSWLAWWQKPNEEPKTVIQKLGNLVTLRRKRVEKRKNF